MKAFKNYDVVIVGSGVAGLYAAYNLSPTLNILLLSKREQSLCNSALAQGGIAGVYKNPSDSPEYHKHDTLVAGGYENKLDALDILVNEACQDIGKIIDLGVDFDKQSNGDYHRTLEGGHGLRRIFHHKDATGYEILSTLITAVDKLNNVTIIEDSTLCGIKKTGTGFSLDVIHDDEHNYYNAHYTILCTGGIGRVYEFTTNSCIATGDGITLAYELGAKIENLSYIQFHPTAFNNKHTRECFLISEAVRGEGAYLRNCFGERFMHDYDHRLELAPRDVVSHAIMHEAKRTGSDDFTLDITHKEPEYIKNRFPMIYTNLLDAGYDLTKDRIPIFPCQHYLMGGIQVDTHAQSTIENLYACGECSCTGVHGNNRLASNSLLEALVFSRKAAIQINEKIKNAVNQHAVNQHESAEFAEDTSSCPLPKGTRTEIRRIMQSTYFVVPDMQSVPLGLGRITDIREMLLTGSFKRDRDFVEAKSLATCAYIILNEVSHRKFREILSEQALKQTMQNNRKD